MRNQETSYRLELIVAILSGGILLASRFVTSEELSDSKMFYGGLAALTLLLALALLRFRMHVDAHASRVQAKLQRSEESITFATEHARQVFAAVGFFLDSFKEAARRVGSDSDVLDSLIKKIVDLTKFRKTLDSPEEVYRHDTEQIKRLKPGDEYRATHPFRDTTEVLNKTRSQASGAFGIYIEAQCDAVRDRQVRVVRIYIVDDHSQLNDRVKLAHLDALVSEKIDVRIVKSDRLDPALREDFVLIGEAMVGIGESPAGTIQRATLYVNEPGKRRHEYQIYDRYFQELSAASEKFAELRSKVVMGGS